MSARHGFSFDDVVFRPGILRMLGLACPANGERVLDLAAGSGMAARMAGELVGAEGRVTALDMGRNVMKKARSLYNTPAPAGFVCGDAQTLPFGDNAFDLVLCHQGLQFFRDRQGAVGEMRRVTAHGGRVVSMTWAALDDCPFYAALASAMGTHLGPGALAFIEKPFSLPDREILISLWRSSFMEVCVERVTLSTVLPSVEAFVLAFLSYVPADLTHGPVTGDRARQIVDETQRILAQSPLPADRICGHLVSARNQRSL